MIESNNLPSKQYFKEHPLEEMSTGMMLYTSAVMPELREAAIQASDSMKAFNPSTIENCTLFMAQCSSDCSDWIRKNYTHVKDAYARSRLCVVLGLKGGLQDVPFLMGQVEYFKTRCPETDYDQAPLVALYHLKKVIEK